MPPSNSKQAAYVVDSTDGHLATFMAPAGLSPAQVLAEARKLPGFSSGARFSIAEPGQKASKTWPPKTTYVPRFSVPTKAETQAARDRAIGEAVVASVPAPARIFTGNAFPWADKVAGVGAALPTAIGNVPKMMLGIPTESSPVRIFQGVVRANADQNKAFEATDPGAARAAALAGLAAGVLTGGAEAKAVSKAGPLARVVGGSLKEAATDGMDSLAKGDSFGEAARKAAIGGAVGGVSALGREYVPLLRGAIPEGSAADRERLVMAGLLAEKLRKDAPPGALSKIGSAVAGMGAPIVERVAQAEAKKWLESRLSGAPR